MTTNQDNSEEYHCAKWQTEDYRTAFGVSCRPLCKSLRSRRSLRRFAGERNNEFDELRAQLDMADYLRTRVEPSAVIDGVGWQMGWGIAFPSGRTFRNLIVDNTLTPLKNTKEYVLVTALLRIENAATWRARDLAYKLGDAPPFGPHE